MSDPHQPDYWAPDGEAFCWQPKAALRRIREACDAEHSVASAIGVYVALTEIASDKQSKTFQTTHSFIAMKSGLSPRTVQQRVKDLASIGVLQVSVPSLKTPATYTLLHVQQPLPNDMKPLPRARQPLHTDEQPLLNDTQRSISASLPTSKEVLNNKSKKDEEAYDTSPSLTVAGKRTSELMELCHEVFGEKEMSQSSCQKRWYGRALVSPAKLERVLADVAATMREKTLDNPAAFAETLCKEVYQI